MSVGDVHRFLTVFFRWVRLTDHEWKVTTHTQTLCKVVLDTLNVLWGRPIRRLHYVAISVAQESEISAHFHIWKVSLALDLGWLIVLGSAPRVDFTLLTDRSWGVPSRDRNNLAELTQKHRLVLVVSVASAYLTFTVVTSSPYLAINQKQGVVFSACNHLNAFVPEEF